MNRRTFLASGTTAIGALSLAAGGKKKRASKPRKIFDKPNRIGDDHLDVLGKAQAPARRIQGGEQPVFNQCPAFGQGIEKCRFSRIGISDDGYDRQLSFPSPGATLFALFADKVKGLLQV